MPKNRNMGRRSHRAQDAQLKQNMANIDAAAAGQPTRPYVSPQQATKSSKEEPRNTK